MREPPDELQYQPPPKHPSHTVDVLATMWNPPYCMTHRIPAQSLKHFQGHRSVLSTWRKAQKLRAMFKVTQTTLDRAKLVWCSQSQLEWRSVGLTSRGGGGLGIGGTAVSSGLQALLSLWGFIPYGPFIYT